MLYPDIMITQESIEEILFLVCIKKSMHNVQCTTLNLVVLQCEYIVHIIAIIPVRYVLRD